MKCQVCGTKLSQYNKGPNCYAHTEGMPVKTHYPVSKCWSRKEPQTVQANIVNGPITADVFDSQNEAFTESVTGVVINGKVVDLNL